MYQKLERCYTGDDKNETGSSAKAWLEKGGERTKFGIADYGLNVCSGGLFDIEGCPKSLRVVQE